MKIGRLAPWYRWIEYAAFGRALEKQRLTFLPRLAGAHRVLVLGEGDGRTLARLLTIAPQAHFEVMELSPEMIALARRRTGNSGRVNFRCEDARQATWPTASFDVVITHFFIDCLNQSDARSLISQLANALAPGGIWLISEFAIPQDGWRRWHARLWIWTMYRFFRVTTRLKTSELPPISNFMRQSGMHCIEQRKKRAGLIVAEVWAADRHL